MSEHYSGASLFRCRRCLYPSSKPDIHYDSSGLCSACQAFDRRQSVDWGQRKSDFLRIVNLANSEPDIIGAAHDVVVAVSGGKDSTWQVVKCLELGLRPLAVCASTDDLSHYGRKNLDNIAELCDLVEVTVHKPTRRKISRFALQEVGDISWCEHHLIWSVPAREAANRNIPIVLYGECPQNEYGAGPPGSETQTNLTLGWVHEFGGLLGLRLSDVAEILEIEPRHLELYRYPSDANVRALFMGAYFEWDGKRNFEIAQQHGFRPWPGSHIVGSLFNYENVDNLQTGIHDYIRFLKFGYGRACDIASNHIRRGYLTRDEAVKLVQGRDGAFPSTYLDIPISETLAKIGLSVTEFMDICERFRNREVVEWASSPASYELAVGQAEETTETTETTEPTCASNAAGPEDAGGAETDPARQCSLRA